VTGSVAPSKLGNTQKRRVSESRLSKIRFSVWVVLVCNCQSIFGKSKKKGNEKGVGISLWVCEFLPSIETRGKTLALYHFCSSFARIRLVSVGEMIICWLSSTRVESMIGQRIRNLI
jgi:hypothetical protein